MGNLLRSSKFWLIVKLILAGLFLYHFATKWDELDYDMLSATWNSASREDVVIFGTAFLLLFALNWISDTYLWWMVVKSQMDISFKDAFKINLISHAVGLVTPANIGEYGIKALHFTELGKKRQSVLLTFSYRWAKWYVKMGFGAIAGIYLWYHQNSNLTYLLMAVLAGLIFSYRFLPSILDRVYHGRIGRIIFDASEDKNWNFKNNYFIKSITPAIIKFTSYTGQLALLLALGSNLNLIETFWRSSAIYSIASFIPTLSLIDPMVKAGLGEFILSDVSINLEWIALSTALVWLTNLGIPSLIGYGMWLRKKAD